MLPCISSLEVLQTCLPLSCLSRGREASSLAHTPNRHHQPHHHQPTPPKNFDTLRPHSQAAEAHSSRSRSRPRRRHVVSPRASPAFQARHKRLVSTPPPHTPLATSPADRTTSWDSLYTTELTNHASDPSDIGTVWFDDSDAEAKILGYLSTLPLDRETTSFLDLGCGNGSLLFSLRDDGPDSDDDDDDEDEEDDKKDGEGAGVRGPWTGRMLGVDYSPQSVRLARQISTTSAEAEGRSREGISFDEWDVLAGPMDTVLNGPQQPGWDVVLDKGTFDAISLAGADASGGDRRPNEGYKPRVLQLVKPGGLFLITSCNWTEPELRAWFEDQGERSEDTTNQDQARDGFVLHGRVEYRTFSFGGHKGQTITTLCFRRQS